MDEEEKQPGNAKSSPARRCTGKRKHLEESPTAAHKAPAESKGKPKAAANPKTAAKAKEAAKAKCKAKATAKAAALSIKHAKKDTAEEDDMPLTFARRYQPQRIAGRGMDV